MTRGRRRRPSDDAEDARLNREAFGEPQPDAGPRVHPKSISIRHRRGRRLTRLEDSRHPWPGRPVEADQTLFMLWVLHRRDRFCAGACPLCDSRWVLTKRPVRRRQ
jgi:hypothetical protein